MRLRLLLALPLLALALAGCGKLQSGVTASVAIYKFATTATVTQGQANALHDGIAILEKAATKYTNTCRQPANNALPGCGKAAVGAVGKALVAVRAADDDLWAAFGTAVKTGADVGVASTFYNAAVDAANTLATAQAKATAPASAS